MTVSMEPRIDYARRCPDVRTALWALEHYVHQSGLGSKLLELVKLRVSLINGCACCVDMHTKVARSLGERNRLAIAFRTVPGTFQIGRPAPRDREAYSTNRGQPKAAGR